MCQWLLFSAKKKFTVECFTKLDGNCFETLNLNSHFYLSSFTFFIEFIKRNKINSRSSGLLISIVVGIIKTIINAVKPLITNTSEEFIKCRLNNF